MSETRDQSGKHEGARVACTSKRRSVWRSLSDPNPRRREKSLFKRVGFTLKVETRTGGDRAMVSARFCCSAHAPKFSN